MQPKLGFDPNGLFLPLLTEVAYVGEQVRHLILEPNL